MSGLLIVGENDCPVEKVVSLLESKSSESGYAASKWADVAEKLDIPLSEPGSAENGVPDLVNGTGQIHNLIGEWVTREGKRATLGYLIRALKSCGLEDCAKLLLSHFHEEITAAKLSKRLKSELATKDGLFWAVDKGQANFVEELVRGGADVNWKDVHGETALHRAAKKCERVEFMKIVKFLVSNGADLHAEATENAYVNDRYCKVSYTFFEKLLPKLTPGQFHEFWEFLIENGKEDYFSKPARTSDNTTPVQLAVKTLNVERRTLKLLMEKAGVNFHEDSPGGNSLLHIAALAGRSADFITDLIETCGVDPYRRYSSNRTAYDEVAAAWNRIGVAKGVLEALWEYECC